MKPVDEVEGLRLGLALGPLAGGLAQAPARRYLMLGTGGYQIKGLGLWAG